MAKSFPELTNKGKAFIKAEEGAIPYVYDDAVYPTRMYKVGEPIRGNLTAGIGHLLSRGKNIFPEAHKWIGRTIPDSQIDKWFDDDTDEAESAVHEAVEVPLSSNQRDTLISFTFNVGVGAFKGSTLLRKLNAANYEAVPNELAKWTKTTINGKKVTSKGLVRRRANEAALWAGGSVPIIPDTAPLGTQIAEATKQPITPTEALAGAGTIITGAAGFANSTGFIAVAFGIGLVITFLVVGAILIKRYVLDNPSKPADEVV